MAFSSLATPSSSRFSKFLMKKWNNKLDTLENKRKQSGFSQVFFCFSNWPKAQLQLVEPTLS